MYVSKYGSIGLCGFEVPLRGTGIVFLLPRDKTTYGGFAPGLTLTPPPGTVVWWRHLRGWRHLRATGTGNVDVRCRAGNVVLCMGIGTRSGSLFSWCPGTDIYAPYGGGTICVWRRGFVVGGGVMAPLGVVAGMPP